MRNILDKLIWIGLFIFFVPTTLIIVSWNSLPGELMFPIKLGLERSLAVIVSPSYEVSGQLQIKYTERRFADAQKLLAIKNSVSGLPYLDQQVETAKTAIEKAPNPAARQVLANQYIATLTQVSGALEQQKQTIMTSTSTNPQIETTALGQPASESFPLPTPLPTSVGGTTMFPRPRSTDVSVKSVPSAGPTSATAATPTPAPTLTTVVTTTGATPPQQNIVVAMQITRTQQQINKTIDDLKKQENQGNHGNNENKPAENMPTVTPDHQTDSQNNKDNKNNKD